MAKDKSYVSAMEGLGVGGLFWTNTVWYLLLGASGAAMFAVALAKSKNRRFTAAFTCSTVGLFYIFEFALITLNSYAYSPGVFPGDPFLDTYMGNVFSQTSIAAASSLIIAYRLKPYWVILIAFVFYGVQFLFMSLGIFTVYWYKAIYTPLILVPLFMLLRSWHDRAVTNNRVIDGFLLHFLGVLAAAASTVAFPLRVLNLFVMSGGFYTDPSRDNTTTSFFYSSIVIGMLVLAWRSKRRRMWMPAAIAAVFGLHFISWKVGLIVSQSGWFPIIALIQITAVYLWVCGIGRLVEARLTSPKQDNK